MLGRFESEFTILPTEPDGKPFVFTGKLKRESPRPGVIREVISFIGPDGERKSLDTTWSLTPGRVAFASTFSTGPDMIHGQGKVEGDGRRIEIVCNTNGNEQMLVIEFLEDEDLDEQGNPIKLPFEKHTMLSLKPTGEPNGGSVSWQPTSTSIVIPVGLGEPDGQAMFGYMLPSEAHKRLLDLEGEWTTKVSVTPVGLPTFAGEGRVSASFVLGKRFIEERHSFTLPIGPVELVILVGHNNGTGKFEVLRAMSMATGMDTMSGKHNADTGEIVCEGEIWEPRVGDLVRQRATIGKSKEGVRTLAIELDYGQGWKPTVTVEYTKVVAEKK